MPQFAVCVKAKVVYHPAPKNAGSSMRQCLFEIDNGRPYRPMIIDGKNIELFMIYGQPVKFQAAPPMPEYQRFALVRDPVSRFLSAYANRVLDPRWRNRSHEQLCQSMGLPAMPDIDEFIDNLQMYQSISEIRHHTRSQRFFLGDSLSYYDRIFKVENLPEAIDYLSSRSGVPVDFPALKADGPKLRKSELSDLSLRRLKQLLASDYELLSDFYDG